MSVLKTDQFDVLVEDLESAWFEGSSGELELERVRAWLAYVAIPEADDRKLRRRLRNIKNKLYGEDKTFLERLICKARVLLGKDLDC